MNKVLPVQSSSKIRKPLKTTKFGLNGKTRRN